MMTLRLPNISRTAHNCKYRPVPIGKTDRYTWFKVGPALVSSHGMGQPSFSILLHEVTKLLSYAEAEDVTYFRLGSSGGVGVPPGTVVLTTEAVDGEIKPQYSLPILGNMVHRRTTVVPGVVDDIVASNAAAEVPKSIVTGKTMSADCFVCVGPVLPPCICLCCHRAFVCVAIVHLLVS
eukprot:m.1014636 g.1014636  ORF g.1014636 m.1014636 type:complete len:179 (+) comp24073_c1_seq10:463-999(+)